MSVIRTGSVYQRTAKGPNYVCLGKAKIGGQTMIISVKNGNIRKDGRCKLAGGAPVTLHAHYPENVARIHQTRSVNLGTVFSRGGALPEFQEATKRMLAKGIETEAELPNPAELR